MQAEYWQEMTGKFTKQADWVEYGNDIEGTAFEDQSAGAVDPVSRSFWNLRVSDKMTVASSTTTLHGCVCGLSSTHLVVTGTALEGGVGSMKGGRVGEQGVGMYEKGRGPYNGRGARGWGRMSH